MATNKIYALLVGIDIYEYPVRPLSGCVNDIYNFHEYMINNIGHSDSVYNSEILVNEDATRANVIDRFVHHLGQAGADDTAMFYFAGHGAQEICPPELRHMETSQYNQTLVCYDSREQGNYDLADKEVAQLIASVAQSGCHCVVILDSCHSGSGSRGKIDEGVRMSPLDQRSRPLESYIFPETLYHIDEYSSDVESHMQVFLPQGQHVLLAACEEYEEAKEKTFDSKKAGVFSHFLYNTLQEYGAGISYQDLIEKVKHRTQSISYNQNPVLESTESELLDESFLGGF